MRYVMRVLATVNRDWPAGAYVDMIPGGYGGTTLIVRLSKDEAFKHDDPAKLEESARAHVNYPKGVTFGFEPA